MANTIKIDVVSAEESILSEQAEFVVAPAQMGDVGIYPNHASMIKLIKAGSVRIKMSEKTNEDLIYISGGILEVQPGHITILSDTAIRGKDLDETKAKAAKKAAEEGSPGTLTLIGTSFFFPLILIIFFFPFLILITFEFCKSIFSVWSLLFSFSSIIVSP